MTVPLSVEVRGLVKRFGDLVAVDGIDLEIRTGECVGILGPNGAGKTTTLEILEGLQAPSEGTVRLLGLSWATDGDRLREQIGVQLQETHLIDTLTVEETVVMFDSFYRSSRGVDACIDLVQLGEKRDALVRFLSGGQRQRLALALALVASPELLFLDEPSTGLDPQARRAIWDVIDALKASKKTVLLTTHSMEEAERVCDRVVIMDRGKIVADGTPAELIRSLGADHILDVIAEPAIPAERLQALAGLRRVQDRGACVRVFVDDLRTALPGLAEIARASDSTIANLTVHQPTLDDVFLNLTGRSLREEAA